MISVLIVDDSRTTLKYLCKLVEAEPDMTVVGTAVNGLDAIAKVKLLKPQVVIMDIEMPELDGISATRQIMEENPVPIIICSANLSHNLTEKSYRAIQAGALAAVVKPRGAGSPGAREIVATLLHKVKVLSEVKVVRRRSMAAVPSVLPVTEAAVAGFDHELLGLLKRTPPSLIAIGASTGGPLALRALLAKLKQDFPLPILIVQHIASGFLEGMVSWLQSEVALVVTIAAEARKPLPGHAYFAPDGYHLELADTGLMRLLSTPREYNVQPAVAPLFRSLARPQAPPTLAILLTGMGRDGALELLAMRQRGQVTIAQDEASAVVNGMPGEAWRLGAVQARMSPEAIGELLDHLALFLK
ncbi:MAG: chemotaxis-specific protein-glutamate methyltransferase CheB [Deltaproteobacteria bacterium]|nr:chemotaxis-specific protein-glutamate methyltransferase CheB [Deltaproteobacteria bacterium]